MQCIHINYIRLQTVSQHVECKEFCKIITFIKKIDHINYSFETNVLNQLLKIFGNLSILPVQLMKKGLFS